MENYFSELPVPVVIDIMQLVFTVNEARDYLESNGIYEGETISLLVFEYIDMQKIGEDAGEADWLSLFNCIKNLIDALDTLAVQRFLSSLEKSEQDSISHEKIILEVKVALADKSKEQKLKQEAVFAAEPLIEILSMLLYAIHLKRESNKNRHLQSFSNAIKIAEEIKPDLFLEKQDD
jgi:hypothetical protein